MFLKYTSETLNPANTEGRAMNPIRVSEMGNSLINNQGLRRSAT